MSNIANNLRNAKIVAVAALEPAKGKAPAKVKPEPAAKKAAVKAEPPAKPEPAKKEAAQPAAVKPEAAPAKKAAAQPAVKPVQRAKFADDAVIHVGKDFNIEAFRGAQGVRAAILHGLNGSTVEAFISACDSKKGEGKGYTAEGVLGGGRPFITYMLGKNLITVK